MNQGACVSDLIVDFSRSHALHIVDFLCASCRRLEARRRLPQMIEAWVGIEEKEKGVKKKSGGLNNYVCTTAQILLTIATFSHLWQF